MKPKLLLLLLLAPAVYAALLYFGINDEENSKATFAELERDFKALSPYPKATRIGGSTGRKSGLGHVGATYLTDSALPEVRSYYDSMLLARGWHLETEDPPRVWGHIVRYKKDRFTASLHYAGQRQRDGWDFAFSLSWGLH